METRLAVPADAALLAALHAASFGAAAWSEAQIAGSLGLATSCALIAADEQGFILVQSVGDEAEILTLGVAPAARRRGTGRTLVAAALARLKAGGGQRIFLEVAQDNPAALALYAEAGFTETGRRPAYYPRQGHPVDAVLMARAL